MICEITKLCQVCMSLLSIEVLMMMLVILFLLGSFMEKDEE